MSLILIREFTFGLHFVTSSYHLKLFHEEATQYYEKCNKLYFNEPAHCPALLLVSKTDPVGTEAANRRLMATWESIGIKV